MTISRESLWTAIGIAAFGVAVAIDKADAPHAYTVTITAYVSDAQRLCRQAWDMALAQNGPAVAEAVTMTRGEFDTAKCLGAAYQISAPVGVASAGIEVTP
jgi:hypothetical protein